MGGATPPIAITPSGDGYRIFGVIQMYVKAWRFPDRSSFHFIMNEEGDIQRGIKFDSKDVAVEIFEGNEAIKQAWRIAKMKTANFTLKEYGPICN